MKFRQEHRQSRHCKVASVFVLTSTMCNAFTTTTRRQHPFGIASKRTSLYILAPQGSGYATPDDETSPFPDTYEPMMEYPGTMRPGRTPEDQPFHDLPIGDDDPDPVPWPHFQQIEWHHRWDPPPHPHPIPMEEFIELQGRWATPEMEAAMRAGARRDVRQRQEAAEQDKRTTVVMDDDEDDFEANVPVELGDGMFGQLGSGAENAVTAAAVAPPSEEEEEVVEKEEAAEAEDDYDDFLLDLGLDADGGDDDTESSKSGGKGSVNLVLEDSDDEGSADEVDLGLELGLLDDDEEDGTDLGIALDDDDDGDISAIAGIDDDDDGVDFDEDAEDLVGDDGVTTIPLDDGFGDSDATEGESPLDDGGFDYDDGDIDGDGGDVW